MKPHKHAELIKAWADGAEIEVYQKAFAEWEYQERPTWHTNFEYRIKSEPKPDVVRCWTVKNFQQQIGQINISCFEGKKGNLLLTFDGETGELKSAEVLK